MPLLVALIHFVFIQANSARILVDLFMRKLAADVRENKSQFDWIMETSPFHRNCRTVSPLIDRFTYDFTFQPFHTVGTMKSMWTWATPEFVYFSSYSMCVRFTFVFAMFLYQLHMFWMYAIYPSDDINFHAWKKIKNRQSKEKLT